MRYVHTEREREREGGIHGMCITTNYADVLSTCLELSEATLYILSMRVAASASVCLLAENLR